MLFTFGVGAIVDLPHLSVMVMGLDDWPADPQHRARDRRRAPAARGAAAARPPGRAAAAPRRSAASDGPPGPVRREPPASACRWRRSRAGWSARDCQLLAPLSSGLFELKADPFSPTHALRAHQLQQGGKPPTVVPARFLVACENGHLDDFPWVEFVHEGPTDCHDRCCA